MLRFVILIALKRAGSWPGSNRTSTTGPITWTMFPLFMIPSPPSGSWLSLERLGAADDLHQLLGDRGLAGAVHLQREPGDHIHGVVGRRIHRRHPGAVLSRHRLEEDPEDLRLHVLGEEDLPDLLPGRLVEVAEAGRGIFLLHFPRPPRGGLEGDRKETLEPGGAGGAGA